MRTPDQLRPYQQRAIDRAFNYNETILRIKMGGGKTVIVATTVTELLAAGHVNRVLIFAPARVAKKVWPDEFSEWSHLDPDMLGAATGTAEQRMQVIESGAPIVVMSFNNIPWFFNTYPDHSFDCLVIDELTKLKDRKGKWFRTIVRQLKKFKIRIGATGTLVSEGVKDLYGQAFVIDRGVHLGRTHGAFQREFFIYVGPNHWDWVEQEGAAERAARKLAPITFQITGAEYEDQLPPLVTAVHKVELPLRAREHYTEIKNEFFASLDDGTVVDVVNAGVKVGKMQQIAQGFLYKTDEEGRAPSEWRWLHDAKLDVLEELIDISNGEPLLVAYRFRAELEELLARWPAPYLGAGVSDKKAEQAIDDWNAGKLPILYIHPQSAGHGLNLQKGGNTIVWFGLTWSLDDHDQLNARLRRSGQEADTVWAHYIVADDTVDETIQLALEHKRNVQEAVYVALTNEDASLQSSSDRKQETGIG